MSAKPYSAEMKFSILGMLIKFKTIFTTYRQLFHFKTMTNKSVIFNTGYNKLAHAPLFLII